MLPGVMKKWVEIVKLQYASILNDVLPIVTMKAIIAVT